MAIEIIELPVATLAEANPYFDFESIDTANPDWIWMLFGSYGKEIASKIPLETTRFPYYTQWPKIDPEQRFAIAWPIWGQERYPIHMQGIDEYLAQEGFEHEKRSLPYHLFIPKAKKNQEMLLSRFGGGHGGPLRIFTSSKLSICGSVYRNDPFNHPMLPYIWLGGKDAVGQNISAKLVSGDEEYPPTGDWGSPPMSNGFLVAVN